MNDDDKPIDGDEEKPENPEGKQDTNVNHELSFPEKFKNNLTPDDIVDRVSENLRLFKEADDFAKKALEGKERKKKEQFALQSGELRTLESYTITQDPMPYIALFGKDVPFFKEMFRVCDIDDKWNPNSYPKPPIAGVLMNELVWRRLGGKKLVDALRAKAFRNGERRYKFSQFFDADDKAKVIQFRTEAIEMMKDINRGNLYEFRRQYAIKFKVDGFQYKLPY